MPVERSKVPAPPPGVHRAIQPNQRRWYKRKDKIRDKVPAADTDHESRNLRIVLVQIPPFRRQANSDLISVSRLVNEKEWVIRTQCFVRWNHLQSLTERKVMAVLVKLRPIDQQMAPVSIPAAHENRFNSFIDDLPC